MPSAKVKTRKPNDTRERLIEAGTDLMWEFGYNEVAVDDIILRASVLKGSFYHFFPSKKDFLIACLEGCWDEMSAELDVIYAAAPTPQEALDGHMLWFIRQQEQQVRDFGRVLGGFHQSIGAEAYHIAEVGERTRSLAIRHEALLRRPLDQLAEQGRLDDPEHALTVITYCIDGALYKGRILNSLEPTLTLRRLVARLLA